MYKVNKDLHDRENTLNSVLLGMQKVFDKVSVTTGALGKHVLIETEFGYPKVINDGIGILKDMWLEDPLENLGCQLMVSSAEKTARAVGDNTSMTAELTYAFSNLGWHYLKNNKHFRAVHMVNGMKYQANEILKELLKYQKFVKTPQELFDVAYIASRDESVSNLIVQAIHKAGDDGVIHIVRSQKNEDHLEFIDGMRIDSGIVSPELFLDKASMVSQLDNPKIVLINDNVERSKQIYTILRKIRDDEDSNNNILIIANSFSREVISAIIGTNKKSKLDVQLLVAPGVSDMDKLDYLMDIQSITGGQIYEIYSGVKLETADVKDLGYLDKVLIQLKETRLFREKEKNVQDKILERVKTLQTILEDEELTNTDLKKAKLEERIAKLTSGVALVRIYAPTEEEFNDKWERTDDALRSVKSALAEGLLPGGAVALKDAKNSLESKFDISDKRFEEEFNIGRYVVLTMISLPFEQVLENAEYSEEEIKEFCKLEQGVGVNVFSGEVGNMMDNGVIDTFLGARMSIINAISTSTMLLRSHGSITIKKRD